MIAYLEGKIAYKDPAYAIIDVQGVGYEVRISLQTYSALPELGGKSKVFTFLNIREDAHILFGFAEPDGPGYGSGDAVVVVIVRDSPRHHERRFAGCAIHQRHWL